MNELITKELFSLVYGHEITHIELMPKINDKQELFFHYLDEDGIKYEESFCVEMIGRLCKEWIRKQRFIIEISIRCGFARVCAMEGNNGSNRTHTSSDNENEYEAIIKATQWVMEQTK